MRPAEAEATAAFLPSRPRLVRIAYRMLGSVADAQDIVQEAYLRWHRAERSSVRDPEAFLIRVVTRLCLDHHRSARARRETYVGPWLPEPLVDTAGDRLDDLDLVLMLALECLSPLERAAFLLHDIFDQDFQQVAEVLDRDTAACRQLAARARTHLREARPRYRVSAEQGMALTDAFIAASRSGDVGDLRRLLQDDVMALSDGGGIRRAALNPLVGIRRVAGLFAGVARKFSAPALSACTPVWIDGLPGYRNLEPDGLPQLVALQPGEAGIAAIYVFRNPQKLSHLPR